MNDAEREFLTALEDCSLDPARFDHRAHLYAAWLCLREKGEQLGGQRFCIALRRYAEHLGATGKYHETVSRALLALLAEAMRRQPDADFDALAKTLPELFADAQGLLGRHYSPERLSEDAARSDFVAPDREPLPD